MSYMQVHQVQYSTRQPLKKQPLPPLPAVAAAEKTEKHVATPSATLNNQIFEDDRIVKHAVRLKKELDNVVRYALSLRAAFWNRFASVLGLPITGEALRCKALKCMLGTNAYLH